MLYLQVDLIRDRISKAIVLFAIPILTSNKFQQFYNTMDTMIVGDVLGDTSLVVIGACGEKDNSFLMMPGMKVPASVAAYVSQNKGSDQRDRIIGGVKIGCVIRISDGIFKSNLKYKLFFP